MEYLHNQKGDTRHFKIGEGRTCVRIMVEKAGKDLIVVCTGGTVPHIGAIAIGVPIPRKSDPSKHRASVSVVTIPPHREDLVVRPAAEKLSSTLVKTTVVAAGIHLDNPTPQELQRILEHCDQGINLVIDQFTTKTASSGTSQNVD